MSQLTFYQWLQQQVDRDDQVGDLAKDVRRDPNFEGHSEALETASDYLDSNRYHSFASEALEDAWRESEAEQR
jgi:uncharacterized protein YozE (UPF0346 family)